MPSAEDVLRQHVTFDPEALQEAIANLMAEGYSSAALGLAQDPLLSNSLSATQLFGDDPAAAWDAWQPGNIHASQLLEDGGFQDLLGTISIKGMDDTTLGRMGTALAEGAERGDSVDAIARSLGDIVSDPKRAYMIADTELARAVSAASQATYQINGVRQWTWLLSPGACPLCQDKEAAGPFDTGDPYPPAHPHCRCSSAPVDPGTR